MHRRFVSILHHHGKKNSFCDFNNIHRRHATYCMIKTKLNKNKEMFKDFFPLLGFDKCNSLFLINVQETFSKFN